jgi:DNA-binding NarL/FixJ family response regulator
MIKVAITDDHALMRQGIINVLSKSKNIQIVLEASNGWELINLIDKNNLPDVLLLDIQMPQMDGHATLSHMQLHYPSVKVIMLSVIQDKFTVNMLMQKGAAAFISKNAEAAEFIEVIETIASSHDKNSQKNFISILDEGRNADLSNIPTLSTIEIELLKYCPSNLTYEQIADLMQLSPKTLENHRSNLFKKLKVQSRSELAAASVKMGLVW